MNETSWLHDESPIPIPPTHVIYEGQEWTVVDRRGPWWMIEQAWDEHYAMVAALPEELYFTVRDDRPVQACYSPGLLDKVGQIMAELYLPPMQAMLEQENVLLRWLKRDS